MTLHRDAFDTGGVLRYSRFMHIGTDWSKEITDEAKDCGCKQPRTGEGCVGPPEVKP